VSCSLCVRTCPAELAYVFCGQCYPNSRSNPRSHSLSKPTDIPPGTVPMHTLVSSKRLSHDECHRLPPAARTIAAAALAASEGLIAAAPSVVRRASTISKERLQLVKILAERLVLAQLTASDKFGLNVAATVVAFGSVDCVSFLLMDRSLPHNQTVNLLVHSGDAYVSQDVEPPARYVTVSLLHIAALRGDATIIRLLCRISPSSVNALSSNGMTALHYAIAIRSPLSCIDALLAHGADPSLACDSSSVGGAGGVDAFVLASCVYSDALELLTMHAPPVQKNVAVFADSNAEDDAAASDNGEPSGQAELTAFVAAARGDLHAVSRVLKRGFDAESRNDAGQTLLMVACAFGQRAIAKRVMKHGADMDAADSDGKTAAHIALQRGKQDMCDYLLQCGASKDLPDTSGVTVAFLLANPESLASYAQQLHSASTPHKRHGRGGGSSISKQTACLVLQRFSSDVAQSYRARCYMQMHGSCANNGPALPLKPWPKKASYIMDRHRRMYATIVMLQSNVRRHQAR
jgi:ankyrin repeat protein